ncbi:RNA polymerase subunit sigma-70 [uncultured Acetatifactor sp.]|uniref:RNA polymerase subunit sigma-70 n=1 Tax=uncultured Acetatifactor sp. TaxID=1671927 RepID=UPI0026075A57|nr:RNA polymerase subunit sigma-70 [uncultured Acetatifactor sp.]
MDKRILQDYIDACELLKETEKEINRLNQKKKTIIQDSVKGSSHEYPYIEQHFKVQGTAFTVRDDSRMRREEELLEQRKANAEKVKLQVEMWMLTIPFRMQRIIRYRFFEGSTWEQVANKLGRKASGESARKEFENFMRE